MSDDVHPNAAGEGAQPTGEGPAEALDGSIRGGIEAAWAKHEEADNGRNDDGAKADGGADKSPATGEGAQERKPDDSAGAEASGDGQGDKAAGENAAQAATDVGGKAVEPPAHWSVDDQKRFREATPEWQKWILDRSKAMDAAHTQRSQEIAPLRNVVQKWDGYLRNVGTTAELAFDELMKTERLLRTGTTEQKRAAFQRLAADYGVDVGAGSSALPNGASDGGTATGSETQNPAVAALQREVAELRATLSNRDTQEQNTTVAQRQAEVEQFKTAKGEDGELSHPHFDEVEQLMAQLAQAEMAAGVQPKLSDLYERACWASPAVREKILHAQQHAAEQKRKADERAQVEKARRANGSVAGAGSGRAQAQPPKSVRAAVEAAVSQHGF